MTSRVLRSISLWPLRSWNTFASRMLKKSASFVLSSSKSSTYPRGYASGFDSLATLLDSLFEHPPPRVPVVPRLQTNEVLVLRPECIHRLLDIHRLVHVMERRFGDFAGSAAAISHDVSEVRGIFTQARARVPHRCHAFDDSIGNEFLAIDAADGGSPAFGINLLLNHR